MDVGLPQWFHGRLEELTLDGGLGVAVSGGGDSTALLLFAAEWANQTGRVVEAATVDHGLRAESGAEAASVSNFCASIGIRHETLKWRDPPSGGNRSAVAREARIALLGDWARRRNLETLALGHTLDDQAETLLLRLARGAGVDGLSGMEARVLRDNIFWIRPLLEFSRADLRDHLRAQNVAWADDPTNDDETYARIRMRRLIAASPDINAVGLATTAKRLQGQRTALEWLAKDLAARVIQWGGLGEAVLDVAEMACKPEDTQLRLLADTLRSISGAAYRPKQTALQPLLAVVMEGSEGTRTLHGCIIAFEDKSATICREPSAATEVFEAADGVIWDGRWRIESTIADAKIARLGEAGEAALSATRKRGEWTAPEKWSAAPRSARLASPALWLGEALVAAPLADFGPARAVLTPSKEICRPSRRDAAFGPQT